MTATETNPAVPAWFAEALDTRPTHGTLVVDDAEIAYRVWDRREGDGDPRGIVLVHGGAAHAGWWDHIGPQLARTHRVVAFDLSGHGDSEWREGYTYDRWADELVAVAAAVGIVDDLVVVGHSMGGIVAMRAAVRHPEVVTDVVIVDSELFDAADIARMMEHGAPTDTMIPREPRRYATRDEALARYRLLPEQETLPYIRDHVAAGSVTRDEKGWRWKFDRSFPTLLTDPTPVPPPTCTLAIVRAEHGVMDPSRAQALHDSRSDGTATLVTLAGAGHHVMLDRPLELLAELRDVLGDRQE